MKKPLLIAVILLLNACTKADDIRKYAEEQGWKSYTVTGYRWLACSKDDFYHTGFTAVTRDGKTVTGVICSGAFFKGATMRLD